MTLKEYSAKLQKFMFDNPGIWKLEVVTSSDDEGNSYNPVKYEPQIMDYDPDTMNFWDEKSKQPKKVICIN